MRVYVESKDDVPPGHEPRFHQGAIYFEVERELAASVFSPDAGRRLEKIYIDSPDEAPPGANVQVGPRGGMYYESAAGGGGNTVPGTGGPENIPDLKERVPIDPNPDAETDEISNISDYLRGEVGVDTLRRTEFNLPGGSQSAAYDFPVDEDARSSTLWAGIDGEVKESILRFPPSPHSPESFQDAKDRVMSANPPVGVAIYYGWAEWHVVPQSTKGLTVDEWLPFVERLFGSGKEMSRTLKKVYIDSPDEAPPGANVQVGPRGGMYYESAAGSGGEPTATGTVPQEPPPTEDRLESLWPEGENEFDGRAHIERFVDEATPTDISIPVGDRERVIETAKELVRIEENNGILDGLNLFTTALLEMGSDAKNHTDADGLYNAANKRLWVSMSPSDLERRRRSVQNGWLAVEDPRATLWHELGHHTHHRDLDEMNEGLNPFSSDYFSLEEVWVHEALIRDGFDAEWVHENVRAVAVFGTVGIDGIDVVSLRDANTKLMNEVEEKVSRYASTSPHEFVAEVFSMLMAGERVDEDMLELYDKLGGTRPPPEVVADGG